MAQNLQLLKRRIKTAGNISQIAKAMEMIAASKIKKAQSTVSSFRPYAFKIIERTQNLLIHVDLEKFSHPYLKITNSPKKLLIIIAPDKGLCGALVTNLLKKLLELVDEQTHVITIGKKIERTSIITKGNLIASFPMGSRLAPYASIYPLIKLIDEYYKKGEIGSVEIVYTEFKSIFSQLPTHRKILPIIPATKTQESLSYIFEPSLEHILDSLLPYYLEVTLYNALIDAFTSEQASRMIAMQNAKNNANDISTYLTLLYNRARQEKITNELLDLTNGQIQDSIF